MRYAVSAEMLSRQFGRGAPQRQRGPVKCLLLQAETADPFGPAAFVAIKAISVTAIPMIFRRIDSRIIVNRPPQTSEHASLSEIWLRRYQLSVIDRQRPIGARPIAISCARR